MNPYMDELVRLLRRERHRTGKKKGWGQSQTKTQGSASPLNFQFMLDPEDGQTWTVQLHSDDTTPQAEATITYCSEGANVTRRVSIGSGTQVTGPASDSILVAIVDQSNVADIPATPLQYVVHCSVAPGTRPNTSIPPRLDYTATGGRIVVGAGGNVQIPVPKGVGVTSAFATVIGNPSGVIAQGDALVTMLGNAVALRSYDPRDQQGYVSLLNGTDVIELVNPSGANQFWSLSFGIDG